jgi:alpha-tubulin suppressor-like RCC1 family protein
VAGSGQKGELGLGPNVFDTENAFLLLPGVKFSAISCGFSSNSGIEFNTGILYLWGNGENGCLGKIKQNTFTPCPVKLPYKGKK